MPTRFTERSQLRTELPANQSEGWSPQNSCPLKIDSLLFVCAKSYTRGMPTPHQHHSAPPPHRDDCEPPIQQPAPLDVVTRAAKAVPCWVDLAWASGRKDTYPAFAEAWTRDLVYVQWVEQSEGRRAWVLASQCQRRVLKRGR